jgi:hypothetical protein
LQRVIEFKQVDHIQFDLVISDGVHVDMLNEGHLHSEDTQEKADNC